MSFPVWMVTVSFSVAAGPEQSRRKGAPCCLTPGLSLAWPCLLGLGWLADSQGSTRVSLPTQAGITSKGYFTQLIYVDSRVGIQGSHPCVLSTLLSPKPHFFAFTFETGSH